MTLETGEIIALLSTFGAAVAGASVAVFKWVTKLVDDMRGDMRRQAEIDREDRAKDREERAKDRAERLSERERRKSESAVFDDTANQTRELVRLMNSFVAKKKTGTTGVIPPKGSGSGAHEVGSGET